MMAFYHHGYLGNKDERTDEERYLQEQLDREREWREQEEEQRRYERERREQERRERYEFEMRTAQSWPEALRKQESLLRRESGLDGEDFGSGPDYYFTAGADACNRARKLWVDHEKRVQAQIDDLEQQIKELRASIAHKVAADLREEVPDKEGYAAGWNHIAGALEEDPAGDNLDSWLYW